MYENGTTFICGAFFAEEEDIEELIGTPIIFAINQDIDDKTTWNDLYASKTGSLKYFHQTNLHHNSDKDGDGSQPIIKATWLDSVKCSRPEQMLACAVQINHETQPFFFLKDSKNNFVFTDYEKFNPLIRRPLDNDENELDDIYCLGSTLGVCFIDVLLSEEQKSIQKQLYEEENDMWNCPPFYIMFGLDGQLYVWEAYHNRLQKSELPVPQSIPIDKSILIPPQITMKKTSQQSKTSQSQQQSLVTPHLSNFPLNKVSQIEKNDEREEYGDEIPADPADKINVKPNKHEEVADPTDKINLMQNKQIVQVEESQQIEDIGEVIRLDASKPEEQKVQEEQEIVDPEKINDIQHKIDGMKKIMDENERKALEEKMDSLELMLEHLGMQMSEYDSLPKACQGMIDQQLKDFKKRAKYLDAHEEEVIELIKEPQMRYDQQKLADESHWRQQFQESLCSTQPQDKYDEKSLDEINAEPSPNTFQLYVLKLEEALTRQYNQTVVRQMRSMIQNFHADMKSFPNIDPKEIDLNDQNLPIQVIEQVQNIRNIKIAVQNIGQAQEMMKRELDKGLPTQESFEIMNRSVNMCKSDFEYFQLLINRLKEYRVTCISGNFRKLFTDAEVDNLQTIIQKAKKFENKLSKIIHQIDRLSQIPIVVSQQLQQNQQHMTQFDITEMMKVVDKHADNARKVEDLRGASKHKVPQNPDGSPVFQPTENHHVIKQIASDFSNFNMRIQGSFISELFNSLQKHLQTLDNFLKQTDDKPASPPLQAQVSTPKTSTSKPQEAKKVVSWGAIQDNLDPEQDSQKTNDFFTGLLGIPVSQKSSTLSRQNKRKAIREKLRGGSYRTTTHTIELEAGIDLEKMIQGEHQRVKGEVDQFKQVLQQCSYERFVSDRDNFEGDLSAQINLQNLQIPPLIPPDQIPAGIQLAAQSRLLSPPRNLENSLLNISLEQQHQKQEQIKNMIIETEQKKLQELQKIRQRIEQEEKLIQDKIMSSKVLQQLSEVKNKEIPKKLVPAEGQAKPKAFPSAPKEMKKEEKKEEEAGPGGKYGAPPGASSKTDQLTPFQQNLNSKKEPEKQKLEAVSKPMNPLAQKVLQKGQEAKEKAEKDNEAKIQQALTNFKNSKSGTKELGKDMIKFENQLGDLLCNSNEAAKSSLNNSAHQSSQSIAHTIQASTENKGLDVIPQQTKEKQQPQVSKPQDKITFSAFTKLSHKPQNEKKEDNAVNAAPVANKFDKAKSPFTGGFSGIKGFGNTQQDQTSFGQVSMNQIATNQMDSGQPQSQTSAKGAVFGNNVFGQANIGFNGQGNTQATFEQFTANAQSQQQNSFFSASRLAQMQQTSQNPTFASSSGQNADQQPQRNAFTGGGFQFTPSANMANLGGANAGSTFADDGNDPFAHGSAAAQSSQAPNQAPFGNQSAPPGSNFGFGLSSGPVSGAGPGGGGFSSQLNFGGGGQNNFQGSQFTKARKK